VQEDLIKNTEPCEENSKLPKIVAWFVLFGCLNAYCVQCTLSPTNNGNN